MPAATASDPIVNRDFAEKFLTAVDRPFSYGVYFLFHDFWAEASQETIDAYAKLATSLPGAAELFEERYLADPITMGDLEACGPGTLGESFRHFIVDNGLEVNLARNYQDFNEELSQAGTLDRLPDELSYLAVRGFQVHDYLHVLTGFSSKPLGELAQSAFHFAQLQFPYNAFRIAVTTAHAAFVNPALSVDVMDALMAGWQLGRTCENIQFVRWEEELHTPLDTLRDKAGIDVSTYWSF